MAPNVTLIYSFESSGTLLDNIEAGADCDLFISAAPTQMNALDGTMADDAEKNPDGQDLLLDGHPGGPAGKQGDLGGARRATPRA